MIEAVVVALILVVCITTVGLLVEVVWPGDDQ